MKNKGVCVCVCVIPIYELSFRDEPPSYTDRVLYHSVQLGDLTLNRYESAVDATGSDHRPVRALFTLTPRSTLGQTHVQRGRESERSEQNVLNRPFAWGAYLESPMVLMISMSELSLLSDQLEAEGEPQIVVSAPFMAEHIVMKESGFTGGYCCSVK